MSTRLAAPDPWVDFACALLAGMPRLEGAACISVRGKFAEAENGNRVRVHECIAVCRRCPALAACSELARGRNDLVGVWAGQLRGRSIMELDANENESDTT